MVEVDRERVSSTESLPLESNIGELMDPALPLGSVLFIDAEEDSTSFSFARPLVFFSFFTLVGFV